MELYMIRHGETIGTEQRLYYGQTDLSLTPAGLGKLEKQREQGGYPCLDGLKIYVTERKRTIETLGALYGEVAYEVIPEFSEINFGIFEMTTYESMKDDPLYRQWIDGDHENNIPPQGESVVQFRQRVLSGLDRLIAQGKSACLFGHSGTISMIMAQLFPEESRHFYDWSPNTGEGYCVKFGSERTYRKIP